eukprot:COSAG01_NODE_25_length_37050_cov_211.559119_3_plen_177_part_00
MAPKQPNRGADPSVWSMFESYGAGCGDRAVAELQDYYGLTDNRNNKDDNDTRACAKVPLDFWYVYGMPMVLNSNRATHCNWTNGTCGKCTKLITHESEPPDPGTGAYWDLHHPPFACIFKQDQSMWELDGDEPFAWKRDELVLQPVLAKFKWQPSTSTEEPITVWRRNIEASPAAL